jgi:hypothetical protein
MNTYKRIINNKDNNNFQNNLAWSEGISDKILRPGFYNYVFDNWVPITNFPYKSKALDLQKQGIDIVARASKLCSWAPEGENIFIDEKIQRPPAQFKSWNSFAFETKNNNCINNLGWANKEFKYGQFILFAFLNEDYDSMNIFILNSCIIKDVLKAEKWEKKVLKNGQSELTLVPHNFVLENYANNVYHYSVWETGFKLARQKVLF